MTNVTSKLIHKPTFLLWKILVIVSCVFLYKMLSNIFSSFNVNTVAEEENLRCFN